MKAINWNRVADPLDKEVWDRLTANFWLPEKISVSNDLASWRQMPEVEKDVVRRVFATLTLLDTIQGIDAVPAIMQHLEDPHEQAVLSNIGFMEHVHAKSYSNIFSTLCSTQEIDNLFKWVNTDKATQHLADTIQETYWSGLPEAALVSSVIAESFLFYTGFYAPLRLASEGKLTNTADIIRLILRDEGVHGYYLGAKFQQINKTITEEQVHASVAYVFGIEAARIDSIYGEVGWAGEVKCFLRYNANKALANLGFNPLFPLEDTRVPAYILASLDPGTGETHDFFSGSGASYVMGEVEDTTEEDWNW